MEEEKIRETIKYPCRTGLLREMDKNAYMENLYACPCPATDISDRDILLFLLFVLLP